MSVEAYSAEAQPFADRGDAGRQLAEILRGRVGDDVAVLGLPRGGVPVAFAIASTLRAPLDVLLVRKVAPIRKRDSERPMATVASGGVRIFDETIRATSALRPAALELFVRAEQEELERREQRYRGGRAPVPVAGRTVILVDDGLAGGSTMRAAIRGLRERGVRRIVAAIPVVAPDTYAVLERQADETVCLLRPRRLTAVGRWYADFRQTSDDEVARLLAAADD